MDDLDDLLDGFGDFGDDESDSFGDDLGGFGDSSGGFGDDEADDDSEFGLDFDGEQPSQGESELSGFDDTDPESPRPSVDKKRTLIIGGIGLGIILIVFIIAGFIKANKDKPPKDETVYETNTIVNVSPADSQVKTVENPVQQPIQQQVQYNDGWTVIEPDKSIDLDSEVSGVFTVTKIKHMARSNGVETEVKTVASGSISGLTGTYDLELPYSLARFLTVGNTLKLKYKIGQINGSSIISDFKVE